MTCLRDVKFSIFTQRSKPLFLMTLVSIQFSLALFFASIATIASAASRPFDQASGALYVITDDPSENKVLSFAIGSDGHLEPAARATSTHGRGAHGINVPPPNGGDPLFSQGAVVVNSKAKLLATVNAGSNTVALFRINPTDPTRLTLIGGPTPSGGEFPQSVAFNSEGNEVCVLNGGKINGVNCFTVNPIFGLTPKPNTLRVLGRNQTTPPMGPANTLGQIIFSPDDSRVIATVKGNPAAPGFIATWSISRDGSLSPEFTKSSPAPGGAMPFSLTPIPGSNAFLSADPAIGFGIYDFSGHSGRDDELQAISHVTSVPSQKAICWSAHSSRSGNFYVIDAGASVVTEVNIARNLGAKIVKQYPLGAGSNTLDSQVASVGRNDFLYVLSAGTTEIKVLNVNSPGKATSVQTFAFASAAKTAGATITNINLQGLATYIRD